MKFSLGYDGELRSNGSPRQKWEIRAQIAPQLQELWQVHAGLSGLRDQPWVPRVPGYSANVIHHSNPGLPTLHRAHPDHWIDVCEPIAIGPRSFFPLVRNTLALKCSLKVLFLRKEDAGRVYQGGDLDNRIKTLFDALSMPNTDQIVEDGADPAEPIYCLVEDDSLITGVSIETQRLLSRPNASKHQVRLVIEVDVRIIYPQAYNMPFLAD